MITSAQRLYNWCKRFRHRCGYGVHSPSDFYLITSVIYESYPYYAYKSLKRVRFDGGCSYRTKVYRLLFRLINYYRPHSVIDIACDGGRALSYMKAASRGMKVYSVGNSEKDEILDELNLVLKEKQTIDSIHIGFTPYYKEIFENVIDKVDQKSVIIVGTPYSSKKKKEWWNEVKLDSRVVISFDLYDIGILAFPEKRYKQNYIVNFL